MTFLAMMSSGLCLMAIYLSIYVPQSGGLIGLILTIAILNIMALWASLKLGIDYPGRPLNLTEVIGQRFWVM